MFLKTSFKLTQIFRRGFNTCAVRHTWKNDDKSGIEFWFLITFNFDALCSSNGREQSEMLRKCEPELKQTFSILFVDLCFLRILYTYSNGKISTWLFREWISSCLNLYTPHITTMYYNMWVLLTSVFFFLT